MGIILLTFLAQAMGEASQQQAMEEVEALEELEAAEETLEAIEAVEALEEGEAAVEPIHLMAKKAAKKAVAKAAAAPAKKAAAKKKAAPKTAKPKKLFAQDTPSMVSVSAAALIGAFVGSGLTLAMFNRFHRGTSAGEEPLIAA